MWLLAGDQDEVIHTNRGHKRGLKDFVKSKFMILLTYVGTEL
jgi:hypothetical protein